MKGEDEAKAANLRISCETVGNLDAFGQDQWADQKGFLSLFESHGLQRQ